MKQILTLLLCLFTVYSYAGEPLLSFGGHGQGKGQFASITSITELNQRVYVADNRAKSISQFTRSGQFLNKIRHFINEESEKERFDSVDSLASGKNGLLYVLDSENAHILTFDHFGQFQNRIGSFGNGKEAFNEPEHIHIDYFGYLWVADTGNNRVVKLNEKGGFIKKIDAKDFILKEPSQVKVGKNGDVFIVTKDGVAEFNDKGRFKKMVVTEKGIIHIEIIDTDTLFWANRHGEGFVKSKTGVKKTKGLPTQISAITQSGKRIYIGDIKGRKVYVFDTKKLL